MSPDTCALEELNLFMGFAPSRCMGHRKVRPQWESALVQTFRGPGSWFSRPNAIAVDSANNVVDVTGSISITPGCDVESCDPYGSDLDYATIKYSSAGEQLWVARYSGVGGSGVDEAFALAFRLLGKCLCDRVEQGRQWAVRLRDNNGNQLERVSDLGRSLQWSRQCLDDARAIKVDSTGNVYVTGGSTGAKRFLDYATIKYSPSGEPAPGWRATTGRKRRRRCERSCS